MYSRAMLRVLLQNCFKGKVIMLIGPRQVGKTTLLKQLQQQLQTTSVWFNADEADVLHDFTVARTSTQLLHLIGEQTQLVIIDEAQQIPDIGKKLKLLYDARPEVQVIATGSSAFDLNNEMNEPLTGRKRTYYLYPISYAEIASYTSVREAKRLLDVRLVYGSYPEVLNNPGKEKEVLVELVNSYLYKDVLRMDGIRKTSQLQKILQALAFQVGSEVSYHEIANLVGNINTATVERYINILEKAYVVFKLQALHRNQRNELKKGKKYFFYDNGVRNVLISNFASVDMRLDKGALWENFLITERLKYNHYNGHNCHTFFWRTHDGAEVDYIEESDGILNAYEFKWKESKLRVPASFLQSYPNHHTKLINRDNFEQFVML